MFGGSYPIYSRVNLLPWRGVRSCFESKATEVDRKATADPSTLFPAKSAANSARDDKILVLVA
jgi:hypothetical protein